jgi:hypothetical protein
MNFQSLHDNNTVTCQPEKVEGQQVNLDILPAHPESVQADTA